MKDDILFEILEGFGTCSILEWLRYRDCRIKKLRGNWFGVTLSTAL
jgi:hypothetical protein